MKESRVVLETKGIRKEFPGVVALDEISIQFRSSEVHALVGENGAGKSTLMKIISGDYTQTDGQILLDGKDIGKMTPKMSQEAGIAFIRQELSLLPELTVAENIYLGREQGRFGKVNFRKMNKDAKKILDKFKMDINPKAKVGSFSVAQQQIIEIAKALSLNANIIIMDEPTDVLTDKETEKLFEIIKGLRKDGKAILYISHRLEELQEICDVYTVLRDGKVVGGGQIRNTTQKQIVDTMVGRELTEQFPRVSMERGKEVLRVDSIHTRNGMVNGVSFEAYEGEILCFSGLVGSGRSELIRCILGADRHYTGDIYVDGKKVKIRHPLDAMKCGIFMLSENRKEEGIIAEMSILKNMTLSSLDQFSSKIGVINKIKERAAVKEMISTFDVKTPTENKEIKYLSGGNQQKVLVAKGAMTKPKIMLFDEPTRGIDVGSKVAIYNIMNELKEQGVAVIMISSEIPEVLGISDRIIVMHDGVVTGSLSQSEATEAKLLEYAFVSGKTKVG